MGLVEIYLDGWKYLVENNNCLLKANVKKGPKNVFFLRCQLNHKDTKTQRFTKKILCASLCLSVFVVQNKR